MIKILVVWLAMMLAGAQAGGAATNWYVGDQRCPPPKDDGTYSPPYDAKDHPGEYPAFQGADKAGWSCSYPREDGVIVQFGNSLTPQQQWLAVWSAGPMD